MSEKDEILAKIIEMFRSWTKQEKAPPLDLPTAFVVQSYLGYLQDMTEREEKLKEALRFYAEKSNWDNMCRCQYDENGESFLDTGEKAREVLEELDNENV